MSGNPGRSKLGQAARLDPRDRRTLHRLGDLHRIRLNRFREAAGYYAKEARCEESEGFEARAIALWRLALRCDPGRLEGHERIGALYVELGRLADARQHYERSAEGLREAGLVHEAAILRAHLAALAPAAPAVAEPTPVAPVAEEAPPDDNAADLAADRLQNGRLFHHYGLHQQAREQLELLVASIPEHVEGRQLLVEVCRAVEDDEAAAQHLRIVTRLLVQRGRAESPAGAPAAEWDLPPVEEWSLEEASADPVGDLIEEIREDVERMVGRLERKAGGE